MKRKGYLYEQICSTENLLQAAHNAGKGKRQRDEVKRFEADLDANLRQLQEELTTRTYTTSSYEVFVKYEPKRREIYKLPFRDRVVQWAIMQVLEPVWTPQSPLTPMPASVGAVFTRCFGSCAPTCAVTLTGHGTVLKSTCASSIPPSTTAYSNRSFGAS